MELQLDASAPNGDSLTYTATGLPGGLTLNPTTGVISGMLSASDDAGSPYNVTITVTDGTNSASQSFPWTVTTVQIDPIADQTSLLGDNISVPINAFSLFGQPITYNVTGLPPGLSVDPTTGIIYGTIANNASVTTPYNVTVTATDGAGTASVTFAWNISGFTLYNPGDQTNAEGDTIALQLTVGTNGNPTLTYSATGLPNGLSINPTTGLIAGTIANLDSNNSPYNVTVSATDGTMTSSQSFTWSITHVNLTDPGDQINAPGGTVSLLIQANDPDGDPLTYTAAGLPPSLSINPATGLISGTIASTAGSDTPYSVTVTAADGSHTASDTFDWTVANQAVTVANPDTQNNAEGDNVSLQINATDPSGNGLSYTAIGLPAGLQIDPAMGLISGTIAEGDAATNGGFYQVTVLADDGQGNNGCTTFTWNVNHTNTVPTLGNPGDQVDQTGDVVSLPLSGYDEDDDTVTYSASGLPPGLSINATTGVISGTLPASASASVPYSVTVTASDGTLTASQTLNWFVTAGGVVTLNNPGGQINNGGDSVSLQLTAADANNSTLSYQASGLPPGLSINSNTGLIAGTMAVDDAATGLYTVTVMATDSQGYGSAQQFNWYISEPANALTLTNPGNQSNAAGNNVSLQMQANDPDGDVFAYDVSGLPLGLTIDPNSGVISGTIEYSAAQINGGQYNVTVMAEDLNGDSTSQSFTWTVTYTGQGPWLDDPPTEYDDQGDTVRLALVAGSPEGKTLTYSATGLPAGLSVNPTTGVISGTITAAVGQYTVTAAVADGTDEAEQTFLWQIWAVAPVDPQDSPVLKAQQGSDPSGGKNGAFAWPIQWQVTGNSQSGVIIQRVQIQWNIHVQMGANKSPKDPTTNPAGVRKLWATDWLEAWIVQRGPGGQNEITPAAAPNAGTLAALQASGVQLPPANKINQMNDWLFQTDPGAPRNPGGATKTTYGSFTIKASATFYEGMTEAQLRAQNFAHAGWITGAGRLLSYNMMAKTNRDSVQKFLDKFKVTSVMVNRQLYASWDPAKNEGKAQVEVTSEP